jgi:hypothetical protein
MTKSWRGHIVKRLRGPACSGPPLCPSVGDEVWHFWWTRGGVGPVMASWACEQISRRGAFGSEKYTGRHARPRDRWHGPLILFFLLRSEGGEPECEGIVAGGESRRVSRATTVVGLYGGGVAVQPAELKGWRPGRGGGGRRLRQQVGRVRKTNKGVTRFPI